MKYSRASISALLAVLVHLSVVNAITQPSPSPSVSLVTVTSTAVETLTQTTTSTYNVATTTSTCAVGTAAPAITSCSAGVWSSGSNYYSQRCSSAWLHNGNAITSYANIGYSQCVSHCVQTASCSGVNYASIVGVQLCYLSAGSMVVSAGVSYDAAMLILTTNPCIETVTAATSTTIVNVVTTTSAVTYTLTVTPSSSATSSSTAATSSSVSTSSSPSSVPSVPVVALPSSSAPSIPSSSSAVMPSSSTFPLSIPIPNAPSSIAVPPSSSAVVSSSSTPTVVTSTTSSSSVAPIETPTDLGPGPGDDDDDGCPADY